MSLSFRDNMMNIHVDNGKEWLINLSELVEKLAAKYSLTNLKLDNLTFF